MKLMISRRPFVKKHCIEFHEHSTNGLVPGNLPQTDRHMDVRSTLLRNESPQYRKLFPGIAPRPSMSVMANNDLCEKDCQVQSAVKNHNKRIYAIHSRRSFQPLPPP